MSNSSLHFHLEKHTMATPTVFEFNRSLKVMSSDNTETSEMCNNKINTQLVDQTPRRQNQYIEVPDSGSEGAESESDSETKEKDDSVDDVEFSMPPRAVDDGDQDFLRNIIDLIMNQGLTQTNDRNQKVCEFYKPEELLNKMSDMSINSGRADTNKLLDLLEQIISHSVKTSHPRFFNQLYGGLSLYSMGGAWISEAVNASLYTYEVSPVFTLMEKEVYAKMLKFIGFDNGDAIFAPGGSISNLYAVNVARHKKFPEIKTKGMHAVKKVPCLFTSEKCHYSIQKAASALGIGSDNVIKVKSDARGKMLVSDLQERIVQAKADGQEPFMVVATAGTTVFGAYDPIAELAPVCQSNDLWLHVDGAWGGSVALSKKYRYLIEGVEQADSMTWNAHKMMGVSQQCSVFLMKQKGLLADCHSYHAQYLFQQDKHYDVSYDTGDMSLQCGRKNDVLKLWLQWKAIGDEGMEKGVDHIFELSRYLAAKVKNTDGFRLIMEPMCTNVCFWYIPPSLRGQEETPEWWQKIGKVTQQIKAGMMQEGSMMITYNPEGKLVNFFRMVCTNRNSTTEDMDFVVEEIARLGKDL